jgi:hypothetical protein
MAESYDPRECIRGIIGETHAIKEDSWEEQSCVTIENNGEIQYIPIYLSEEVQSLDAPSMPFIDIKLMLVNYTPHDIGALTRKHEAYLDVGVWFTHVDDVDSTTFGKKIIDKIQDQIRTTQENCGFYDCHIDFINLRSVRYIEETQGRQVIYRYVLEIYCIYYD